MKFKESSLKLYAAPLSDTENEKCKHAIEAISDTLKDLGYTDDQKGVRLLEIGIEVQSIMALPASP